MSRRDPFLVYFVEKPGPEIVDPGADLTVRHLVVSDGYGFQLAGGIINNGEFASLTLVDSTVSGNTAGSATDVRDFQVCHTFQPRESDCEAGFVVSTRTLARAVFVQIDQQLELIHRFQL